MPILTDVHYTKEDVMSGLQLLFLFLAFVAGFGLGLMAYRYQLKRDPEKLEQLAKEAKAFGDKAKDRFS